MELFGMGSGSSELAFVVVCGGQDETGRDGRSVCGACGDCHGLAAGGSAGSRAGGLVGGLVGGPALVTGPASGGSGSGRSGGSGRSAGLVRTGSCSASWQIGRASCRERV